MSNNNAICRESVFQAADALVSGGVKVTNESVRDALGGGSFSTISPFLREWREAQRNSPVSLGDLPDEMMQAIEQSARLLWAEACKIASKRVEVAEGLLIEAREDRNEEARGFERELKRLEAAIMDNDATIARLEITVSAREDTIRALELELARRSGQDETALMLNPQIQHMNEQIRQLQSEQNGKDARAAKPAEK